MTSEKKKEFTLRISQASPVSMIGILYEMLLQYLQDAENAYENGDRELFSRELCRALDCLEELQNSLCMTVDPAPVLFKLYWNMHRKITKAKTWFDVEPLALVEDQIGRLREAYKVLEGQDCTDSVMVNAQTVYAGLTYGRNALNENMVAGTERGFRV